MIKAWVDETGGPGFELFRHFLRHFFTSEFVTAAGNTSAMLAGSLPLVSQLFFLIVLPLRKKYEMLSALPTPDAFRNAVLADELWLITLTSGAIGLLTAIRWRSLLPERQDVRALAALPVTPRQIFAAKCGALAVFAVGGAVVLNTVPAVLLPALSSGTYAQPRLLTDRVFAHAMVCAAASVAACFSLVALHGVLALTFSQRLFSRIAGWVQGSLVAIMLATIVLSFSASPDMLARADRDGWADYLPPFWLLAVYRQLAGVADAETIEQARKAWLMLGAVAGAAVLSSYLAFASCGGLGTEDRSTGRAHGEEFHSCLIRWTWSHPVEQAIADFAIRTLLCSPRHRTVLMGYGGVCLAVVLTVASRRPPGEIYVVVCFHIVSAMAFVLAARHVLSMPVELRANWVFRLLRHDLQAHLSKVINRMVLVAGGLMLFVLPLPLGVYFHGIRGLAESFLLSMVAFVMCQAAFLRWNKVPFTCSVLPGKTAPWIRIVQFFIVVSVLPVLIEALVWVVSDWRAVVFALAVLLLVSRHLMFLRARSSDGTGLVFEETLEPAVHDLQLRG